MGNFVTKMFTSMISCQGPDEMKRLTSIDQVIRMIGGNLFSPMTLSV